MTERITLRLENPVQALADMRRAWGWAKELLASGCRLTLVIEKQTRSSAENRLLHSLLGHISETKEWAGKRRDIDTWKRLLVAAWCRAINEPVELLPALDGNGVDVVYRKTSKLTRKECAELIEYIFAWGADNDIVFPEAGEPKWP